MARSSAGGLLSADEFCAAAEWFVTKSKQIGDGWECIAPTANGPQYELYLQKKTLTKISLIIDTGDEERQQNVGSLEIIDVGDVIDEYDLGSTDGGDASDSSNVTCQLEYHVLYSPSYCVPVMYFNAYKPNGQLLALDDLWSAVRARTRHDLQPESLWTFLTQQEHPILGRPYFFVHPCHTADLMKQINGRGLTPNEYLVSWISTVGHFVYLDLSISYIMDCS